MPPEKILQRRQRVHRGIILRIQYAYQRVETDEVGLLDARPVDARLVHGRALVDKLRLLGDSDVHGDVRVFSSFFQRSDQVLGEYGHHGESLFEGGGCGRFVGVLGGE